MKSLRTWKKSCPVSLQQIYRSLYIISRIYLFTRLMIMSSRADSTQTIHTDDGKKSSTPARKHKFEVFKHIKFLPAFKCNWEPRIEHKEMRKHCRMLKTSHCWSTLLSHPKPSSLTKSVNLNRHIRVWYPICGTWNMGSLCVVDFVASVEKDLATNAKIFNFRAQLMNGCVHTQKTPLGNDNRCFRHDRGFHIIVYEDNKMNSVTSPRRWNLFLFWLWLDSLSMLLWKIN